jgi:hypothetical protein
MLCVHVPPSGEPHPFVTIQLYDPRADISPGLELFLGEILSSLYDPQAVLRYHFTGPRNSFYIFTALTIDPHLHSNG